MWNTRTLAAGAAVTAAAALLAGFAPPRADDDLCRAVDKAEMSRIVGKPVAMADPSADQAGTYCVYGITDDGPFIRLSRLSGDWGQMVGALSDAPQESVPNLGAAAIWTSRDYALLVRSKRGLILRVSLDDDEKALRGGDLKGVAVDVAKQALADLGG